MGAVCISFGIVKSIALIPFFKFLGKWWNKLYKKYTVFSSLVHVTFVSCDDCPRSVLLWLCLDVVVLFWCCFAVLQINTVYILGVRSKNSLIALCDRSPNSRKKHGQTKSTKNNQFYKITHLLCYIFVSCFMVNLPNIFRKKTVHFLSVLYFR